MPQERARVSRIWKLTHTDCATGSSRLPATHRCDPVTAVGERAARPGGRHLSRVVVIANSTFPPKRDLPHTQCEGSPCRHRAHSLHRVQYRRKILPFVSPEMPAFSLLQLISLALGAKRSFLQSVRSSYGVPQMVGELHRHAHAHHFSKGGRQSCGPTGPVRPLQCHSTSEWHAKRPERATRSGPERNTRCRVLVYYKQGMNCSQNCSEKGNPNVSREQSGSFSRIVSATGTGQIHHNKLQESRSTTGNSSKLFRTSSMARESFLHDS